MQRFFLGALLLSGLGCSAAGSPAPSIQTSSGEPSESEPISSISIRRENGDLIFWAELCTNRQHTEMSSILVQELNQRNEEPPLCAVQSAHHYERWIYGDSGVSYRGDRCPDLDPGVPYVVSAAAPFYAQTVFQLSNTGEVEILDGTCRQASNVR